MTPAHRLTRGPVPVLPDLPPNPPPRVVDALAYWREHRDSPWCPVAAQRLARAVDEWLPTTKECAP